MKFLNYVKENIFKFTTVAMLMTTISMGAYAYVYSSMADEKINTLQQENAKLNRTISSANFVATSQKDSNEELKKIIDEMTVQQKKLIKDNKSLNKTNNKYLKTIKEFNKRKELFDKYEYAIITDGYRTDLTYDQIKTGEELMEEKGYDPNLLFGIIMVESSATEDMTSSISTARGYGQILKGTGEFIYTNLMGNSSYNHNYAFNGLLNIEMMTEYLNYLIQRGDNDLYKAIQGYRGKQNVQPYIKGIDKYINQSGTSIAKIAKEVKSRG